MLCGMTLLIFYVSLALIVSFLCSLLEASLLTITPSTIRSAEDRGARWAVRDLDLTVPKGAVYGFLGRNGAGKTTTLRMLLGLCAPTAGRAVVGGADVRTDRLTAARKVGALLEHHGLYGNLTGRQNLDLTRRLLGLPGTEIDGVLEAVELGDRGGDRVAL
jgi:ABC-2 type transport system ATP-binding protein